MLCMKRIKPLRSLLPEDKQAQLRVRGPAAAAVAQQQERLVAQAGTCRDDKAVQGTDVSECGALFFTGAVKAAARTAGKNKVL